VKELESDRHQLRDLVVAARAVRAQERLQFGKHLLDRVEIGTVRRQKAKLRAHGFDRRAHRGLLVDGQIVEDDHIAGPEGGHQHLVDVRAKTRLVDRTVKHRGRRHGIEPQRRDHGAGFPMAARRVIAEPVSAWTSPIAA
jgi:hypothetical protein